MLLKGPLTAEIKCYDDFQFYKSGILIQTQKESEDIPGVEAKKIHGEGIVKPVQLSESGASAGSEAFASAQMAD